MGRQSSRIYYQGKDHKDIYFQGHYHDAMYIGNQLVWKKIRKKGNWKFGLASDLIGIQNKNCSFYKVGNVFLAYHIFFNSSSEQHPVFKRFNASSKTWEPAAEVPLSAGGVELNAKSISFKFKESMIIMQAHPKDDRKTVHIFYTKDAMSWNHIGFIKNKSSYNNTPPLLSVIGTDGTNIIGQSIHNNLVYIGSINSSGEWEEDGSRTESYDSVFYNGMLVGVTGGGRTEQGYLMACIIRSTNFGETWEKGESFGTNFNGPSETKVVGNHCFITYMDNGDYRIYKTNSDASAVDAELPRIIVGGQSSGVIRCIAYNPARGLYGFLIGKFFYQSKDGINWTSVEQNYDNSDSDKYQWGYETQNSAVYIPGVGYYIAFSQCVAFCDNPFDELV